MMRCDDGKAYMVDKTGHAWRLGSMRPQQSGGALGSAAIKNILSKIRWVTIEDPSTAQITVENDAEHPSGVRCLSDQDWNQKFPMGITVKHTFAYAIPGWGEYGIQDYCARKEKLVSLSEGEQAEPTLRDFIDLVHCMTLHYTGDHGVYLTTAGCQPKLWPAHLHKMLAFSGIDIENNEWVVKCKSISQPTEYEEKKDAETQVVAPQEDLVNLEDP